VVRQPGSITTRRCKDGGYYFFAKSYRYLLMTSTVTLASASPRRRELLAQIGIDCRVEVAAIDETPHKTESAEAYVSRLANAKGAAVWQRGAAFRLPVIAADTCVVVDDEIFGKPADRPAAIAMARRLSGRSHQVITAVTVITTGGSQTALSSSRVTFLPLDETTLAHWWQEGETADKAGGYAIQGIAARYISHLEGSYSGVMGLPLCETWSLLRQAGVVNE
jgi:septum formation protein